jgi:hypothetical protein
MWQEERNSLLLAGLMRRFRSLLPQAGEGLGMRGDAKTFCGLGRHPHPFAGEGKGYPFGLLSTALANASFIGAPSAVIWRYLMKSIKSLPVIFLVLKALNPR